MKGYVPVYHYAQRSAVVGTLTTLPGVRILISVRSGLLVGFFHAREDSTYVPENMNSTIWKKGEENGNGF
jgi:hypothetical protein